MADTETIIDVLTAIDADSIVATLGTNSDSANPVQITQPDLIFMLTRQKNALSGEGGTELQISAQTMDTIRWRATSMSMNAAYSVILYDFVAASGANLISPPQPLEADVTDPLPDPADPTTPKTQKIKSYFWNTTVLEPGNTTYHFKFMILDRTGVVQGYYWWDPYIHINS
ncbi:inclusion body family protein [Paracoccus fistulariae]|uniref:Inclusion body family protein n=1 Tax=Paracoccus fistulariae TaxID=658446 RepID=A0ABY7SJZ6_9RHOB|nr:inclusion body family protein [Paracoccus fistulariae]MDB6183167.1 inclusion body family protein [Paracoccus fistulariae]WCR07307.1 inclusion body family protein [Paracoccus fistulariae]